MSKWTHVAGVIRIDHLAIPKQISEETVLNIISEGSPSGSEGGLTFQAKRTQVVDEWGCEAVWGSVTFTGDLRDFHTEDIDEITEWLTLLPKRLKQHEALIRQAVVLIEPENADGLVLICDSYGEKWKALTVKETKKQ